jgi:hypothetical protein
MAKLKDFLRSDELLSMMPFVPFLRSELFYLMALLYESRSERDRSKKWLKTCIEEDKTFRWPAMLAKKELE